MPVYNSEQFLGKALDSILTQSFQDFELILVDDCSKDGSPTICDEYARRDNRVKVYHSNENGGICKARNIGLELAQGQYIAFCDDDDEFLPRLLEENYRFAIESNADMVKFGRRLIDVLKDGSVVRTKDTKNYGFRIYRGYEKYTGYYEIKSRGYMTNLWNGIYKTSSIRKYGIYFDESMRFGSEDLDFTLRLFDKAECIVINPQTYYVHYRRDASSTSRKFNQNKIDSILKTAEHEMTIWDKMPNSVTYKVQKDRILSDYLRNIISIQLLHRDCPYNKKEKVKMVSDYTMLPYMNFNIDKNVCRQLLRDDIKSWITVALCRLHMYRLLIDILSLYRKYFGDNWN